MGIDQQLRVQIDRRIGCIGMGNRETHDLNLLDIKTVF